MTETKDQVRAAVARQAAEWVVAIQDSEPEHEVRAEFLAWLKASPVHVEEYFGVALVARDFRAAVEGAEDSLAPLLEMARADAAGSVVLGTAFGRPEPYSRRSAMPRKWAIATAAIAATVVIAATVLWRVADDGVMTLAKAYRTSGSEQMLQNLPDGSAVHLNGATALVVRYDRDERVVQIEDGQALFTVAHEDRRRFRVVAGQAEVVAIGTRFEVRHAGERIEVTVVEGRVDVYVQSNQPSVPVPGPLVQRVNAEHSLRIDGGVMPAQSERVDVRAAIAWAQHRIAFESRPLGEVAEELNRYGIVQIGIDDPALRTMPIGGVFNAYDTDSFAAFLETLDGVRVERTPTRIRVVKKVAHTGPGESPDVR
jgi:transmembrane sensor